jgi:hypothetical protein
MQARNCVLFLCSTAAASQQSTLFSYSKGVGALLMSTGKEVADVQDGDNSYMLPGL